MFNSSILDVAIGLVFVYLLLGLICTTVNEWISQRFKLRASTLKQGIQALLHAPEDSAVVIEEFYSHPLIRTLALPGSHPAYMDPRTFALAIMDILSKGASDAQTAEARFEAIKHCIANELPDSQFRTSLQILLSSSGNSLETFGKRLETWFDSSMDRVSGWYKNKVQIITAIVAVIVTIFVNADTLSIAHKLMVFPVIRDQIVKSAEGTRSVAPITPTQEAELAAISGWSDEFRAFNKLERCHNKNLCCPGQSASGCDDPSFPGLEFLKSMTSGVFYTWLWNIIPGHLVGWFVTAIAASLGAPFWFDILNRFMNVRAAGANPREKNPPPATA